MITLDPYVIHDAEVALWPAWKDGMPMAGPGAGVLTREPLFLARASLAIAETQDAGAATGHGWTGAESPVSASWQITVDFPDGALADAMGRLMARMHPGGFRIVTVRFADAITGEWTKLTFFYVTPASDNLGEADQIARRAVTLKSAWRQEEIGSTGFPAIEPVVMGEVDWVCGPLRVTAMRYDPSTETWSCMPRNVLADGSRYVTLTPVSDDDGADVVLGMYLPRVVSAPVTGEMLPTARVLWQNTAALVLGGPASGVHHGLTLRAGHALQAIGIPEPLAKLPQDRVLDEPVLVFRFMRRIYATLGHGVLAVPRLLENTDPPVSHDPAFRIPIPGPANPETGQSGLVILPNGAWLDGTVFTDS